MKTQQYVVMFNARENGVLNTKRETCIAKSMKAVVWVMTLKL